MCLLLFMISIYQYTIATYIKKMVVNIHVYMPEMGSLSIKKAHVKCPSLFLVSRDESSMVA